MIGGPPPSLGPPLDVPELVPPLLVAPLVVPPVVVPPLVVALELVPLAVPPELVTPLAVPPLVVAPLAVPPLLVAPLAVPPLAVPPLAVPPLVVADDPSPVLASSFPSVVEPLPPHAASQAPTATSPATRTLMSSSLERKPKGGTSAPCMPTSPFSTGADFPRLHVRGVTTFLPSSPSFAGLSRNAL
jgi:hypothetical protein